MEEERAAAYYDELTRKGGGAARFKQGLGFSSASSNDTAPSKGSALPSASSFLSSFVRASSPSKTAELEKHAQLESIQNKLKKKAKENQQTDGSSSFSRVPKDCDSDRHSSRRNRSRSPSRDKLSVSRYRSRSRSRDRKSRLRSRSGSRDRSSSRKRRSRSRSRDRNSRKRRSRSRSRSKDGYRVRKRSRSRDRRRRRSMSRSRSRSGSDLGRSKKRNESPWVREAEKSGKDGKKERNGGVDYAKMIEGYDKMTPAERVKAKMKLQLSETVEKDPNKGMGSKWERFDFDKDAPLDDEEIEAAEDDTTVVKNIGQSFRFSAVEARREEEIKNAHDQAMFGAPSLPHASETDEEEEDGKKEIIDGASDANLISDQVLTMQQGSWRDRVRKT